MLLSKFTEKQTPFKLLAKIALCIFLAEAVVMAFLAFLPSISQFFLAILDSFLLVLILLPILYYFLFMPMLAHISERKKTERKLQIVQEKLEAKVQERTKELMQKNIHLAEQLNLLKLNADIGAAKIQGEDLTAMLQACCESIVQHLGVAFSRIWLSDESEKLLVLKASAGMYTNLDGKHSRKFINSETKIGNIALTRKPYITNQVIGDSQIIDQDWVKHVKVKGFAGLPLIIGEKVTGVMAMFSCNTIGDTTLEALNTIASELTVGIERLYQLEKLQAEMKKSEQYLDIAGVMLIALDASGRITLVNQRGRKTLGCGNENIYGLNWFDNFVPKECRPEVKLVFKKLMAGEIEPVEYYENPIINMQGEERMIAWHNSLLKDNFGKIKGILTSGEDITEQIKMEKQLRHSQKMESIGTLAGGIAHDFNNILTAIIGNAEIAKMFMDDPEKLEKCLHEVLQASDRAKNLVQQILTFSRKSEQKKQPLRVALVVKEALKLLRSSIPTTIDIKQRILSDSHVLADPTSIHQIVMNLCTNAYHAMRESGGTLSVTLKDVEISEPESIPYLELVAGSYVKLEVSDTGIGLDEKIKTEIFEPYFTTKGIGEGTGLGLAVVHGIVKEHDGIIKLYSEVGQGTSFHIYLPAHQGKSVTTISQQKDDSLLTGGNETIMLVDDDLKILDFAKRSLQDQGYTVYSFTNGVQALQEFQQQPLKFKLVITDMTMPFMTGTQLSQHLLEVKPDTPIILCTGHSELTNREKSLTMGIREYLEKPLHINQLLRTVRKVLDN